MARCTHVLWCKFKGTARGAHLVVSEPGQALGTQDKPVPLGPALDETDVVDGQPALTDDLQQSQKARVQCQLDAIVR